MGYYVNVNVVSTLPLLLFSSYSYLLLFSAKNIPFSTEDTFQRKKYALDEKALFNYLKGSFYILYKLLKALSYLLLIYTRVYSMQKKRKKEMKQIRKLGKIIIAQPTTT